MGCVCRQMITSIGSINSAWSALLTFNMLLFYSGDNPLCIVFVGSQRKAIAAEDLTSGILSGITQYSQKSVYHDVYMCQRFIANLWWLPYHVLSFECYEEAPRRYDPIFSQGGMEKHKCCRQLCYHSLKQWFLAFEKQKIHVKIPMSKW